jgi:hypothetical protein
MWRMIKNIVFLLTGGAVDLGEAGRDVFFNQFVVAGSGVL